MQIWEVFSYKQYNLYNQVFVLNFVFTEAQVEYICFTFTGLLSAIIKFFNCCM